MPDKESLIQELIQRYQLKPLTGEGGLFAQTYCSKEHYPLSDLPPRYAASGEAKPYGTAILYLLREGSFSRMHRLPTDEIYHFYLGDEIEMLQLLPDGTSRIVRLGQDVLGGAEIQTVVPRGTWQGSRLAPGGSFALVGCTMAPGYTDADYEDGTYTELTMCYSDMDEQANQLLRILTEDAIY